MPVCDESWKEHFNLHILVVWLDCEARRFHAEDQRNTLMCKTKSRMMSEGRTLEQWENQYFFYSPSLLNLDLHMYI